MDIPAGGDSLPSKSVLVSSPGLPFGQHVSARGNGVISIALPSQAARSKSGHSEPKPFLRKGSRKEPSALNRAQSQSPSPVSSPDQPAVRPAPHGQQSAHADMRQGQNVSLQDVVRISSHFVPMEESNYVDVLAIKERMSTVQQEVDEFEQLERQLLEASHISDASGLLFSSAQLRQSTERQEQTRQSYQRYGPPAAAPQEDSPDYSDDASASDYGDDDEKEIDGYRGASAVLHKHNSVGGIEHRQSPEPGFDVYRGGRMDEAEDEEEVSLRHLRKSWTGIPSGNVRGSQGMPRVDDSRSWGDVTAPPAGAAAAVASDDEDDDQRHLQRPNGRSHTPIRGYASNRTSAQNTFAQQTAPQAARNMKLKSPGRARPAAGSRSSGAKAIQPDTGSTELDPASDPALRELGNELQRELDTYKRENAAIKAIRKQQETALAEITLQRNKLMKWAEEEKAATAAWAEEQRASVAKEKRALQASRLRSQNVSENGPASRKERAEVQALQATIEKMKLDYDALKKKSKMNDLRLNQLVKDQNDIIADMTQKMDSLQADKEQYEAWIRDSNLQEYYLSSKAGGLTKPGRARPLTPSGVSVVSAVGRVDGAPSRQAAATRGSRLSADEATYAEEVFLFDEGTNTAVNGAFDNDTVSIGSPQQQKSNTLFERKSSGFNENGFTAHSTVGVGRISTLETHSSEDMVNIGTGTVHSVGLLSTIASGRSVGKRPRRVDDVPETMDGIKQEPAPPSNGGRVEVVTDDGTRIISYRNGTRKEVLLDGSLYIQFSNGDTKRQLPLRTSNRAMNLLEEQRQLLRKLRQLSHISGGEYIIGGESYLLLGLEEGVQYDVGVETGDVNIVVYFYDKAQTTHTSFPDGLEVYEFPNRQTEHHFPNGEKLITFADGTTKAMFKNGVQESVFPDGVIVREFPDGTREVL